MIASIAFLEFVPSFVLSCSHSGSGCVRKDLTGFTTFPLIPVHLPGDRLFDFEGRSFVIVRRGIQKEIEEIRKRLLRDRFYRIVASISSIYAGEI